MKPRVAIAKGLIWLAATVMLGLCVLAWFAAGQLFSLT